jgi:4-amino-4-deoxy-L-arabinose transferase-like glycosyltransferase
MLIILIVFSAVVYISSTITVIRWNDPAGYTYAGRRIAETGQPTYYDANNIRIGPYFTLHAFKVRNQSGGNFYLNYSVGLPMLIALADLIHPVPKAEFYVVPVLGVMGLIALFALGRTLFGRWVGLIASGLMAFNFVYWFGSTENWSDVPAVAFLLAGIALLLHATRRDSYRQGLLGGLTLGYACLIRYFSVLTVIPLSLYLLVVTIGKKRPYRGLAGLVTGFGFMAALILVYNAFVFGGVFQTGYSPQHGWVPWTAFSWRNFLGQSPIRSGGYWAVLSTLWTNFHVGLLLAFLGFLIMPRSKALLLGGNAVVVCGSYAFYLWPSSDLGARFLLFAFAMLCLAIAFAIVRALDLLLKGRSYLFGVVIFFVILVWHGPGFSASQEKLAVRNAQGEAIVSLVKELIPATEPNAVLLSHVYHDTIILYGMRSALYYELLAPPDPVSQGYQVADYEPQLVAVMDKLLRSRTPIYVVKEPEELSFRQGPLDPYPILRAHFELAQVWSDPPVYQVLPDLGP